MKLLSHTLPFTVAVDETDYLERLKPSAILQYFQDLATVHATELGIGYELMKAQNLCWVLSRLSVEVVRYPVIGDEIKATTYPLKPGMVEATRDYYVTDAGGNVVIRGTSKWVLLDIANRSIRRCGPLFHFDDSEYIAEIAIADGNPKLPDIESHGAAQEIFTQRVMITDLDRNVHMNNARYGDMFYNACDIRFLDAHDLIRFDIQFVSELKIGDVCTVFRAESGAETFFEGRAEGGKTVFKARAVWADRV